MKEYDTQKILRGKFNVEIHKEAFVNYLEVIIKPDGTVEYAVPSHQEKLIAVATQQLGLTRMELLFNCPNDYMSDFMLWLCKVTGCIAVWNDFHIGNPNEIQSGVLKMLKDEGVYKGGTEDDCFYSGVKDV